MRKALVHAGIAPDEPRSFSSINPVANSYAVADMLGRERAFSSLSEEIAIMRTLRAAKSVR